MDNTMEKIGKLLSDEESVKQISELAQLFSKENSAEDSNEEKNCDNSNNLPDITKIMQFTELIGTFSKNDKNTELLIALKPHLKEERQQKVDKAVKLLKLITIWNIAKENGLLNDII